VQISLLYVPKKSIIDGKKCLQNVDETDETNCNKTIEIKMKHLFRNRILCETIKYQFIVRIKYSRSSVNIHETV